jgi:hypothetical protein
MSAIGHGFANQQDTQLAPVPEIGNGRLSLGAGFLPFYASHSLDAGHIPHVHAIVVIHGALRNAGEYLAAVAQAARIAGQSAVIIAPQFLIGADLRGKTDHMLYWDVEDWKGGLASLGGPTPVSSFSVVDRLLELMAEPAWLPDLARVTIVGNSAGGQFVNRYAAVGTGPELLAARGVAVRFVVSNPSTYLYFDRARPRLAESGRWSFDPRQEPDIDRWRYGFGSDVPSYVIDGPEACFNRYAARDVTYLLGELDDEADAVLLETHPAATAQGRNRRERGNLYFRYLAHRAGRPVHRLVEVPAAGHDAAGLFTSPRGRKAIFSI